MPVSRKTRTTKPFGAWKSTGRIDRRRRDTGAWELFLQSEDKSPGFAGSQLTDSEGHLWPPPSTVIAGDVGGPFFTQKSTGHKRFARHSQRRESPIATGTYDTNRWIYSHDYSCPIETTGSGSTLKPQWPTPQNSTQSSLNALGATAASRCRPTAAEEDLSTAVGETFRDGIPHLVGARTWQSRTIAARNAGDEFLNVEFGWLPLISDVKRFGETVINQNRIIQQYERDRGRLVRRSYFFPDDVSQTTTVLSTTKNPDGSSGLDTGLTGGTSTNGGTWSKTTTITKKRWFKGAFVYGTPLRPTNVGSSATQAELADKLFNLSLTPDVLWNLTPWSWAIDWATNTGDVLAYLGDVMAQGLVMQYGYFMENTIHEVRYSLTGMVFHDQPINVPDAVLVTETKSRSRANPFGFGVTWNGLSAIQAAILAALGISRT